MESALKTPSTLSIKRHQLFLPKLYLINKGEFFIMPHIKDFMFLPKTLVTSEVFYMMKKEELSHRSFPCSTAVGFFQNKTHLRSWNS